MFRAVIFALLVVASSLGVLEFSARTQTSDTHLSQGFRSESATYPVNLASEYPLLPSVSR
jgi:hypothetical protein